MYVITESGKAQEAAWDLWGTLCLSMGPLGYFMDMRGQTTPEVGFYSMINKAKMHLKGNNLDLWGTLWTGVDKLPQRPLFAGGTHGSKNN